MKLKDLVVSPCNVRQPRDDDDVSALAKSIKEDHLINKLVLRPTENGTYEVIAGQRRLKAMQKTYGSDYELGEGDFIIMEGLDDKEAFLLSLTENVQRLNLTPMELCRAALKLNQLGFKDSEVAKKLNITPTRLKRVQNLVQEQRHMPEVAREELSKPVEESHFTDAHWDKVRTEVDNPDVIQDVVDYIIEHEAPARDVPGIITGVKKKFEALGDDAGVKDTPPSESTPTQTTQQDDSVLVYEHKGELTLIEEDGKMTFSVQGKGEDEEIPYEHYLEYLRRPHKFKCRVTLKLKFTPI